MTTEEVIAERKKEIAKLEALIAGREINWNLPMGKWVSYREHKEKRMDKEDLINDICQKLCTGIQLKPTEINMIIRALRESNNYLQEPYYEVIYHDKYDNTETRIMEPIASRKIDMNGYFIQEDRFDLNFRRIVREEESK